MNRGTVRTIPALLLTAGLIASLTSCAGSTFAQGCDSPVLSGDASAIVSASGAFGDKPTVDFPTPLVTTKLQRSVLIPGTGAPLQPGQTALIKYSVLDGAAGTVLQAGDYSAAATMVTVGGSTIAAVSKGLQCATVGSRVAIVSAPKDSGQTAGASGGANDSFVWVIDIERSFPATANGTPQIPQAHMPAVVTAPSGAPGVTVPKEAAPTMLAVNVLEQGHGRELAAGDHAVLKYTAYLWDDSSVFDSTWTKGDAKVVELKKSDTVTSGFVDGLVGKTVGSQVLIVVPPKDGFGDNGSTGVPAGATLIYVVDVLGVI